MFIPQPFLTLTLAVSSPEYEQIASCPQAYVGFETQDWLCLRIWHSCACICSSTWRL